MTSPIAAITRDHIRCSHALTASILHCHRLTLLTCTFFAPLLVVLLPLISPQVTTCRFLCIFKSRDLGPDALPFQDGSPSIHCGEAFWNPCMWPWHLTKAHYNVSTLRRRCSSGRRHRLKQSANITEHNLAMKNYGGASRLRGVSEHSIWKLWSSVVVSTRICGHYFTRSPGTPSISLRSRSTSVNYHELPLKTR